MSKILLVLAVLVAILATVAVGSSVNERLSNKILSPKAKPCAKATKDPQPPPKKQFLDQRLPVVVNDYHPPKGGFNPTHIDDKEVDRAARRILREIQKQQAEDKEMGPGAASGVVEMTTEEHVAFKQLLLDSDILVNAVKKLASENGPIDAPTAKKLTPAKVAAAAVKAAAKIEKKAPKAAPKAAPAKKQGGKKGGKHSKGGKGKKK